MVNWMKKGVTIMKKYKKKGKNIIKIYYSD